MSIRIHLSGDSGRLRESRLLLGFRFRDAKVLPQESDEVHVHGDKRQRVRKQNCRRLETGATAVGHVRQPNVVFCQGRR